MRTTKKHLIEFAISLIKEVAKAQKNIKVEYVKDIVWIIFDDGGDGFYYLKSDSDYKENKTKFKDIVLKIRGIKLCK